MRILVKEVNWLGDLVISLPAVRAIRKAHPAAHLAVLVKSELAPFFDGLTWIDEVIPYTLSKGVGVLADRLRIAAELRTRRYDLAVVLPKSFAAALWPALAGVPRRAGWRSDGRSFLLTDKTRLDRSIPGHQVQRYLRLLRETLGIEGSPGDFGIAAAPRHLESVDAWLAPRRRRPGAPLIALGVAAAYGPAKEWPKERFAAVIDRLASESQAECVLIGAPSEREHCEAVVAASAAGALVAAGELHLGETVALLSRCAGFAGNDSGAMHVAGALDIPTVGIFGSTDPSRTAPLGARARVIYHRIECSPCLARTCRYGHYDCLWRIEASEVVTALHDLGAL